MNWLQSHYNLICYGHSDDNIFRTKSGIGRFLKARLFEHTDRSLVKHYQGDVSRLAELPTLIAAEAMPNGSAQSPAFFSRIDDVRDSGKEVVFKFRHLYDGMSSEGLFGLDGLHFDPWEHSRTHWAVKEGRPLRDDLRYHRLSSFRISSICSRNSSVISSRDSRIVSRSCLPLVNGLFAL